MSTQPRKDKGTPAGGEFDSKNFASASNDLGIDPDDLDSIDPTSIEVADADGEFYMSNAQSYGNPGCECGSHDATVKIGDRYLCAGSDGGQVLLERRLAYLRTSLDNDVSNGGEIEAEIETVEASLAGNPPVYAPDEDDDDPYEDEHPDTAADTDNSDGGGVGYTDDQIMDTSVVPGADPNFTPPELTKVGNGQFGVFSTTAEEIPSDDPNVRRTILHMGGKPSLRAESKAVALRVARSNGAATLRAKADNLAEKESKVTVTLVDSSGGITVKEGRLVLDQSGRMALMNKGASSKGVYVSVEDQPRSNRIVDIESGYGRSDVLAARFNEERARMPRIGDVTFDGIPEDDGTGEGRDKIAAVYMLDHPGIGPSAEGATGGAMFFATDRDSENGIVNGYAVFPGDSILTSEHGSMYENDLKRQGGQVQGFRSGSLTFSDAMTLGERADLGYSGEGDNDIESVWDTVTKASR